MHVARMKGTFVPSQRPIVALDGRACLINQMAPLERARGEYGEGDC